MTKNREISQKKFEKLLNWLDPDREVAGRKYETIRLRLIKVFNARGCETPDELADTTIDIVTEKIDSIAENYNGDPTLYFYGVGRKVFSQYLKNMQREIPYFPPAKTVSEDEENWQKHQCLENCLQTLEKDDRELIIAYYQDTKREKIDGRKKMAKTFGVSSEQLRVRVYRIKNILEKCVRQCLKD